MFTGIVEGLRRVVAVADGDGYRRLSIDLETTASRALIGASIAVNGCCLTVEKTEGTVATFCAITETLSKTTLGGLAVGDRVNVEPSLRAGDDLGGHFVTGHVDGVGTVAARDDRSGEVWITVEVPETLADLVVPKGSITIDGVSLTVAAIDGRRVSVALIPHTLAVTTLGGRRTGDRINLEMDTFGKWVRSFLKGRFP